MTTRLEDADGVSVFVREGQSCNINGSLVDADGDAIARAALSTFTLTLYNKATAAVIHSRSAVDCLNAGPGTVESDGTFRIELDALDNVIVNTALATGEKEKHVARLLWTWNDGDDVRNGGEELEFDVEQWVTPT